MFDCQVKRIHEYKRQASQRPARVVLYKPAAGKSTIEVGTAHLLLRRQAAPPTIWQVIIKFINSLAAQFDGDPTVGGKLKWCFCRSTTLRSPSG